MRLKIPSDNIFGPFGDTTGYLIVYVNGLVRKSQVKNPSTRQSVAWKCDFYLVEENKTCIVIDLDLLDYNEQVQFEGLTILSAQLEDKYPTLSNLYYYEEYESEGAEIAPTLFAKNLGKVHIQCKYNGSTENKIRIVFLNDYNFEIADAVLYPNKNVVLTVPERMIKFKTRWIDKNFDAVQYKIKIMTTT